jgi:hypothetical protein
MIIFQTKSRIKFVAVSGKIIGTIKEHKTVAGYISHLAIVPNIVPSVSQRC